MVVIRKPKSGVLNVWIKSSVEVYWRKKKRKTKWKHFIIKWENWISVNDKIPKIKGKTVIISCDLVLNNPFRFHDKNRWGQRVGTLQVKELI